MRGLRRFSVWIPVVFYVAFIFWLSSAPRAAPPFLRWRGADKLSHLAEYAPLGILLLRAFARTFYFPSRRSLWILVFLAGLAIGGSDEFYQAFVPTRTSSLWDLSADLIGVSVGQMIYGWKRARTP